MAQNVILQFNRGDHHDAPSSRHKSTPPDDYMCVSNRMNAQSRKKNVPIGAPNALATPAAVPIVTKPRFSRSFLKSFRPTMENLYLRPLHLSVLP